MKQVICNLSILVEDIVTNARQEGAAVYHSEHKNY